MSAVELTVAWTPTLDPTALARVAEAVLSLTPDDGEAAGPVPKPAVAQSRMRRAVRAKMSGGPPGDLRRAAKEVS